VSASIHLDLVPGVPSAYQDLNTAVIEALLHDQPEDGELAKELNLLAADKSCHPCPFPSFRWKGLDKTAEKEDLSVGISGSHRPYS
jgi:hypothetical protein